MLAVSTILETFMRCPSGSKGHTTHPYWMVPHLLLSTHKPYPNCLNEPQLTESPAIAARCARCEGGGFFAPDFRDDRGGRLAAVRSARDRPGRDVCGEAHPRLRLAAFAANQSR